ncbi:MAG: hypothetical protein ACYTAN_01790 [Planctomycetota bacterium]
MSDATRWGYRAAEVAARSGLPVRTVRRQLARAGARLRRHGRAVVYHAGDVEALFAFEPESAGPAPSRAALAKVRRLLA